ncbi:MAG TPA: YraN family protein [Gemmatimonadaceae bacterium]|jgi:putative endonuclease
MISSIAPVIASSRSRKRWYSVPVLTNRQELGIKGESIAERWLRSRGWAILDRRFRDGHRDLDLVACKIEAGSAGRLVAFVEVRTRYSTDFGTPAETVGWKKQRELARSARAWIASNRRSGDIYRFDVVGVILGHGSVKIQYVPDAFWLRQFG